MYKQKDGRIVKMKRKERSKTQGGWKDEKKSRKTTQAGNLEDDEKKLCSVSVPDTYCCIYRGILLRTNVRNIDGFSELFPK